LGGGDEALTRATMLSVAARAARHGALGRGAVWRGARSLSGAPPADLSSSTPAARVTTPAAPRSGEAALNPSVENERKEFLSRWKWLLSLLGYFGKESTDIRTGQALFRSCEDQSLRVASDSAFGLSIDWHDNKSFQSRQQLLMLHVWMVHRRLLSEDKRGKEVQETLFDTLWEDTTRRIRAAGVHELTVNKHLSTVQKACFTAAVSYDHGLNISSDENLELGSAIWRNVYQSDPKTPDECVYKMADYVRNQINTFEALGSADLMRGKLSWLDFGNSSAVTALAGEWRQAVAPSGKRYWWNVRTRESRWTKPVEADS